jgi:hypothetical protein
LFNHIRQCYIFKYTLWYLCLTILDNATFLNTPCDIQTTNIKCIFNTRNPFRMEKLFNMHVIQQLVKYSTNFILFITYNSFPKSYNSAFDHNINRKSTQFTIYYTVRCTFFSNQVSFYKTVNKRIKKYSYFQSPIPHIHITALGLP